MKLTDEQIKEIEARAEAATPGPWEQDTPYVDVKKSEFVRNAICVVGVCDQNRLDAAFIAHARQDIPSLLDTIEAQQQENQQLKHGKYGVEYYRQEIEQLQAQNKELRDGLWRISEVAERFYRAGISRRPRKSGVNSCSWIYEECFGIMENLHKTTSTTYHNPAETKIPEQCYKDFGQDLDGCSRQENGGCKGCRLTEQVYHNPADIAEIERLKVLTLKTTVYATGSTTHPLDKINKEMDNTMVIPEAYHNPADVGALAKAREALRYFVGLCGQGLEIANWHQNGETEPFDNFYNSSGADETLIAIDEAVEK